MATNLYPPGIRLVDPADIIAATLIKMPVTINVAGPATLSAGDITGGQRCTLITTNAAPGTLTTRTALQMYGEDPAAAPGDGYQLRICNSGAGVLTLAGGTGVTVSGTATVAGGTFRGFIVNYTGTPSAPIVTMTNIGSGTYP